MNNKNFCKIFIISFLNLIIFLFSVIFLSSVYNIKNHSSYFEFTFDNNCETNFYNLNDMFNKHYKGISALFSFIVIGVFIYLVVLIIIILEDFEDRKNINNNFQNNVININIPNNTNSDDANTERVVHYNRTNVNDYEEDILDKNKNVQYFLFYSFLFIQIFYFIEIIVLAAYYGKSKNLESKEKRDKCKLMIQQLSDVYQDLITVGFIFFAIFLLFYLYLALLYGIIGEGAQERLKTLIDSKYCECCGICLQTFCECCNKCVETKSDAEIEIENREKEKNLKKEIEQKEVYIKNLEKYKNDLSRLCDTYSSSISEQRLKEVNLFRIVRNNN